MIKPWIFWVLVAGALVYLFRVPIEKYYLNFTNGLNATVDAATATGYTTYNQTIYKAPFWQPLLTFFRANSYVPTVTSAQNGNGGGAQYSVQG